MTDTFRALCAELIASWDADGCDWKPQHQARWESTVNRARAALADEPAVPECSEPAAVTGQLSDEEWDALVERVWDKYETVGYRGERFMYDGDFGSALDLVRKELSRWGHQPAPPADGEVAELVAWLRETGDTIQPSHLAEHQRYKRAAELLERQVVVPVAVSVRLPGAEETTEDGEVWIGDPGHDYPLADTGDYDWEPHRWVLRQIGKFDAKNNLHWLPAHALPLPEVGE